VTIGVGKLVCDNHIVVVVKIILGSKSLLLDLGIKGVWKKSSKTLTTLFICPNHGFTITIKLLRDYLDISIYH